MLRRRILGITRAAALRSASSFPTIHEKAIIANASSTSILADRLGQANFVSLSRPLQILSAPIIRPNPKDPLKPGEKDMKSEEDAEKNRYSSDALTPEEEKKFQDLMGQGFRVIDYQNLLPELDSKVYYEKIAKNPELAKESEDGISHLPPNFIRILHYRQQMEELAKQKKLEEEDDIAYEHGRHWLIQTIVDIFFKPSVLPIIMMVVLGGVSFFIYYVWYYEPPDPKELMQLRQDGPSMVNRNYAAIMKIFAENNIPFVDARDGKYVVHLNHPPRPLRIVAEDGAVLEIPHTPFTYTWVPPTTTATTTSDHSGVEASVTAMTNSDKTNAPQENR